MQTNINFTRFIWNIYANLKVINQKEITFQFIEEKLSDKKY